MPKKPKTQNEIDKEIQGLLAVKPRLPPFNVFNESNHAKIDAQVDVLRNHLTDEEVDEKYANVEGVYNEAIEALTWREGMSPIGYSMAADWADVL